ncbi:MAG: D-alanyl-D-alanine carboxypeptidase [Candidatus Nanopelagicales bacterium]
MYRTPLIAAATALLVLPLTALPAAATPAAATPAAGPSAPNVARPLVATGATRTAVSTAVSNDRIAAVLKSRTTSKILGSRFTMTVWDTASSRYIYKRRHDASLRGASTTKILTAVGVLAALGPERRLATKVRAGAKPGEIVLVAGGDPLLTSTDLRTLAASTATALTRGPGSTTPKVVVRADDSLFAGGTRSKGWPSSYVPSQVRPVGAFARDDNKSTDATADAGRYFAAALANKGIRATYAGEAKAAAKAPVLATFAGHSVAQSVAHMLLVSDNDTAEMLFRQVAVGRGVRATWRGARTALADTLRELRVPLTGVQIVDGSGLSLEGRLTAYALTSALNRALSPDHARLAGLRGWLPVAGRTGTLRASYGRFDTSPSKCAAGLIQAKTGTVADAISLAGYANGADGRTKIFVSIVNSRPTAYSRLTTRRAVDRAVSGVTGCW